MEQAPKPMEAPKPKSRTMVLAIIIVAILVVVGLGVYFLLPKTNPPTIGEKLSIWDTNGTCTSATDCGFKDSNGNSNVTIAVGTTVQWTNTGKTVHTATSCDPSHASGNSAGCPTPNASSLPSFDSGTLTASGGTYTFTFNQAGTYYYYCSIHPWMHGEIIVQ